MTVAVPPRRWGLWLAFAAVAALLVLLAVGMTRDPRQLDSVIIGQPWPDRALPLLEKPEHAMGPAQWRGKARVVNLWASWCATCLQEHPALMTLAKRLQAAGHAGEQSAATAPGRAQADVVHQEHQQHGQAAQAFHRPQRSAGTGA